MREPSKIQYWHGFRRTLHACKEPKMVVCLPAALATSSRLTVHPAMSRSRKLETHPKTGAAQLVEIRETVKEIVVPVYVQTAIAAPQPSAEKKCIIKAALKNGAVRPRVRFDRTKYGSHLYRIGEIGPWRKEAGRPSTGSPALIP
jgi:hypothetical protein